MYQVHKLTGHLYNVGLLPYKVGRVNKLQLYIHNIYNEAMQQT